MTQESDRISDWYNDMFKNRLIVEQAFRALHCLDQNNGPESMVNTNPSTYVPFRNKVQRNSTTKKNTKANVLVKPKSQNEFC